VYIYLSSSDIDYQFSSSTTAIKLSHTNTKANFKSFDFRANKITMDPSQQMNSAPAAGAPAGAPAQNKDYGDKAFDMLSKKSGHTMNANTSEKITDGARGIFEKVTG
jgi:hypothetical protein